MLLHFKIIDSSDPKAIGKSICIKQGLIIGRARGNLIIEDERISSVHAEIQTNNQGDFFLVDKDSRNGIKVQGKKITKLLLDNGTLFQVGNTLIEVVLKEEEPDLPETSDDDSLAKAIEFIENTKISEFKSKRPVFFRKPIKLIVIQGIQLNQSWQIEFGPYKFGSGCVGGLLVSDNMPLEVFEIYEVSSGKMVHVLTEQRIVKLNTIPLASDSLVDNGDILSIHLSEQDITRIKFEF